MTHNGQKLPDFDRKFAEYTAEWVKRNTGKYKSYDEMEEHFPEAYLAWINTPASWLDGRTPALYFTDMSADELIGALRAYSAGKTSAPDLLLDQIAETPECEAPLSAIIRGKGEPRALLLQAIGIIIQMQSAACDDVFISWALGSADGELADMAADALSGRASACADALIAGFEGAGPDGKSRALDILSCIRGDNRVFKLVLDRFLASSGTDRALFAAYLCKLGDARALKPLEAAISDPDIGYIDFIEIRNAIESLGGEVTIVRDFTGDRDYEALRGV